MPPAAPAQAMVTVVTGVWGQQSRGGVAALVQAALWKVLEVQVPRPAGYRGTRGSATGRPRDRRQEAEPPVPVLPLSPPVRAATTWKATSTRGPARLLAVTCSHRSQGGEGSSRRQAPVGLTHMNTFWKFLGRVAAPTVRRTGQPRLPLAAQPCSSSCSSWVYSGMKILWPRGQGLAQSLCLPPASRGTTSPGVLLT